MAEGPETDYTEADRRELQDLINNRSRNAYEERRKRELIAKAGAVSPPGRQSDE